MLIVQTGEDHRRYAGQHGDENLNHFGEIPAAIRPGFEGGFPQLPNFLLELDPFKFGLVIGKIDTGVSALHIDACHGGNDYAPAKNQTALLPQMKPLLIEYLLKSNGYVNS
jgi:hypothetical protein